MSTLVQPPPDDPTRSVMENTLELRDLGVIRPDLYTNMRPLWHPPGARGVYGGAVIAQCLEAAQHTVADDFLIHSMHCYFVLAGNADIPVIYAVERVREGRSFATRTVQARQRGKVIFTTTLSFQKATKPGIVTLSHDSLMPPTPPPSEDKSEVMWVGHGPFETQHPDPIEGERPEHLKSRNWIRARGKISNAGGSKAHAVALAYMTDSYFIGTVSRAHRAWRSGPRRKSEPGNQRDVQISMMVSLDHTIYFHKPQEYRADEWLFSEMETPWSGDGRGLVMQKIWTQDGKHIATCFQEGLARLKQPSPNKLIFAINAWPPPSQARLEKKQAPYVRSVSNEALEQQSKVGRNAVKEESRSHWRRFGRFAAVIGTCQRAPRSSPQRLQDPSVKYKKFKPLNLPNRQWPNKTVDRVPRWLATDLRDGNQSLVDPMDGVQKREYFDMLTKIGYKEIEVSFPSASQTDFDFTQELIRTPGVVPDDVWLQALAPCRKDLIRRTVDSLKGAKKAILHIYLATSPCFQQIVFQMENKDTLAMAVECTKYARSITKDDPEMAGTEWAFEYSPETFNDTSEEFVIEVCEAVKAAWEPSKENPIIINLPATVEMSTPNVFADQIEYFCNNITEREKVCVSVHTHNDRGCAVAAAELAQMAGADRVEGVLFGNGERTGNVDLVTLALNMYTQGIHPAVDFSNINAVIEVVERSTKIAVHPRAPYGGDLVVCAFSGSHQDAINKGFKARKAANAKDEDPWSIPYLPLDPRDIGRNYEAIIRVNSQSGKGGVAWIIQRTLNLDMPRGLQVAFSKIVQKKADDIGRELLPQEIKELFEVAYHLKSSPRLTLIDYDMTSDRSASPARVGGKTQRNDNYKRLFSGIIDIDGKEHQIKGTGNGPLSSLADALQSMDIHVAVNEYKEHALSDSMSSRRSAAAYVEVTSTVSDKKIWGIGINPDVTQASLSAMLSAASSFLPEGDVDGPRGRALNAKLQESSAVPSMQPRSNGAMATKAATNGVKLDATFAAP